MLCVSRHRESFMYAADRILFAMISMCLGPIISRYIISRYGWAWIYYISAIVCGIAAISFACMRESRPSLLLRRIVNTIRKRTGDTALHTSNLDYYPDVRTFIQDAVSDRFTSSSPRSSCFAWRCASLRPSH